MITENPPAIPGYTIQKMLREGFVSSVYSAIKNDSQRLVAIKILKLGIGSEDESGKRFLNETATIIGLEHPNIVNVFQGGNNNGLYFIVMEYLEASLRDYIDRSKASPFDPGDLEIIIQIADALQFAHDRGIIHRDVKPQNIMFRKNGTPVLTDFGLAKILHSSSEATNPGITVGSPDYMSPEQIEGLDIDGRADFYSLGITLFEMLTGSVPYKGRDYMSLAMKHIKAGIPKLAAEVNFFQPLINRMMAKDKENRVGNYSELVELIEKCKTAISDKEKGKNKKHKELNDE